MSTTGYFNSQLYIYGRTISVHSLSCFHLKPNIYIDPHSVEGEDGTDSTLTDRGSH